MTLPDIQKIKAATLYILNKCESMDYFHLFKILYFANREHLATYGRPLINDNFCALENGPIPSFLYDAVKMAIGKKPKRPDFSLLYDSISSASADYDYQIRANEAADMDELSLSDIICIDKSIDENISIPFRVLSRKSHDIAWQTAWNNKQSSPMDMMLIARAGGASDGTLAYIRENVEFNNAMQ